MLQAALSSARALSRLYSTQAWQRIPVRLFAEDAQPLIPAGNDVPAPPADAAVEAAPLRTAEANVHPEVPSTSTSSTSGAGKQAGSHGQGEGAQPKDDPGRPAARQNARGGSRKAQQATKHTVLDATAETRAASEEEEPVQLRVQVGAVGANRDINACITRRDLQRFFSGLNVRETDIKPFLVQNYRPLYFNVTVRSEEDAQNALDRHLSRLGNREVHVWRAPNPATDNWRWNAHPASGPGPGDSCGRFVMVSNLAAQTRLADVLRFFQGFELLTCVSGPIYVSRDFREPWDFPAAGRARTFADDAAGEEGPGERAGQQPPPREEAPPAFMVRFATAEEAARAVRMCNGGFLNSSRARMRVLP